MKKLIISAGVVLSLIISASNLSHAQEHRKISSQGKGAIIGGAGGAVAGGIIGHGVGGALIGGAVGAGAGYVIGNEHRRHEEKKRRAREAYYHRHHRYHHA
jgi:uncharacterized protein YcfJ